MIKKFMTVLMFFVCVTLPELVRGSSLIEMEGPVLSPPRLSMPVGELCKHFESLIKMSENMPALPSTVERQLEMPLTTIRNSLFEVRR